MTGTSPKHILFVLPTLDVGGAERVILTIANTIDRTRFSPSLAVMRGQGRLVDWKDASIPLCDMKSDIGLCGFFRLMKLLRSARPDIVVSTLVYMNFLVLLLRPFSPNTIFVVREANMLTVLDKGTRYPAFVRAAYRAAMKTGYRVLYPRADLVISQARCIYDEFRDYLGLSMHNHAVLYNPVDVAKVRVNTDVSDLVRHDPAMVHFVAAGRLERQKGFDRLIRALERAQFPFPWRLDIYGTGREHDSLQALIDQAGLGERVVLRGDSRDLWRVVAAADCFLMPSYWEGFPNVILETLTAGTKVISSHEAGGIAEVQTTVCGAVTVVRSMDEFLARMADVRPDAVTQMRPSLLSARYNKETIVREFEDLVGRLRQS